MQTVEYSPALRDLVLELKQLSSNERTARLAHPSFLEDRGLTSFEKQAIMKAFTQRQHVTVSQSDLDNPWF